MQRTNYEYDANGKLIRVVGGFLDFAGYCQPRFDRVSGDGNLTLSYEGDRLVSIVSDAGDISVVYGYDPDNLLISRTTAFSCGIGGRAETFTYNKDGRLTTHELTDEFKSPEFDRRLNVLSKYYYNKQDQIVSISRSRQRNGLGRMSKLNFSYDSNDELVEIQNSDDGIQDEVYTLAYEDGHCKEQTYTDPEFIVSPTHSVLYVDIYPKALRCGYFLPTLNDR